jgi:hypothetical protein
MKRLLTALFAVAAPRILSAQGVVAGVVRDSMGAPLPDAYAIVQGARTGAGTNASGAFILSRVPVGDVWIIARRIGYALDSARVHVASGDTTRVDFRMRPMDVHIMGTVVTSLPGATTTNASVTLHSGLVVHARVFLEFHGTTSRSMAIYFDSPTPASDTAGIRAEAIELMALHEELAKSRALDRLAIGFCRSQACIDAAEAPRELFRFARRPDNTWFLEQP